MSAYRPRRGYRQTLSWPRPEWERPFTTHLYRGPPPRRRSASRGPAARAHVGVVVTAVLLAGGLYVAALVLILRAGRNLAARCERDVDIMAVAERRDFPAWELEVIA